jgi:hypothetical protein
MKAIVTILAILIFELANGQDCRFKFDDYWSKIDTTLRPVYIMVDSMPEVIKNGNILSFMRDNILEIKSSCCPIYIWYGFVIEADSTLTNIMVCPQLEFCNDTVDLVKENQLFQSELLTNLKKQKVAPGFLKKEKVAVMSYGRIHFECFDW